MTIPYVHGYGPAEMQRLQNQAQSLVELLHADTAFPAGSTVLEAGCGSGAQTVTLAARSPGARIVAIDHSPAALDLARRRVAAAQLTNVEFIEADIARLPFPAAAFDHVFVCFVLEHLAQPVEALLHLRWVLKPGGTLTVIEGDHGSTYFHPDSESAHRAVQCQVTLQSRHGGDAMIGRRLYPLLQAAGFDAPRVSPRMVYVDGSQPALADSFTRKTFAAMIGGIRDEALGAGLITPEVFDQGVADLRRAAEPDGVFCYTFFKATAVRG